MAKAQDGKAKKKPKAKEKPPSDYGCCNDAIDVASEAKEVAGEWSQEARKRVRTRPFAACALSVTAGAIIGALLLR